MGDSNFVITKEQGYGLSYVLGVKGRVNTTNAPVLERELEDALRIGRIDIIVNMRRVEFLSSSGIRVLLSMYKKAIALGGRLRVEEPSENVINVLGMTALDDMLLR